MNIKEELRDAILAGETPDSELLEIINDIPNINPDTANTLLAQAKNIKSIDEVDNIISKVDSIIGASSTTNTIDSSNTSNTTTDSNTDSSPSTIDSPEGKPSQDAQQNKDTNEQNKDSQISDNSSVINNNVDSSENKQTQEEVVEEVVSENKVEDYLSTNQDEDSTKTPNVNNTEKKDNINIINKPQEPAAAQDNTSKNESNTVQEVVKQDVTQELEKTNADIDNNYVVNHVSDTEEGNTDKDTNLEQTVKLVVNEKDVNQIDSTEKALKTEVKADCLEDVKEEADNSVEADNDESANNNQEKDVSEAYDNHVEEQKLSEEEMQVQLEAIKQAGQQANLAKSDSLKRQQFENDIFDLTRKFRKVGIGRCDIEKIVDISFKAKSGQISVDNFNAQIKSFTKDFPVLAKNVVTEYLNFLKQNKYIG